MDSVGLLGLISVLGVCACFGLILLSVAFGIWQAVRRITFRATNVHPTQHSIGSSDAYQSDSTTSGAIGAASIGETHHTANDSGWLSNIGSGESSGSTHGSRGESESGASGSGWSSGESESSSSSSWSSDSGSSSSDSGSSGGDSGSSSSSDG